MPESLQKYLDQAAKLLDPRSRELEPAKGDSACSIGRVKGVNESDRTVEAVVSAPTVDRYEEIVVPSAFKKWLPLFMENPVLCAGHQYVGIDAGEPTVIGSWKSMEVVGDDETGSLVGVCQFADTPLAQRYWELYRSGHMKAFSVGWLTHEWQWREYELGDGVSKKIRVFTEVELIEVSAVAIPANRDALVRQASFLASAGKSHDPVSSGQGHIDVSQLAQEVARHLTPQINQTIKNTFNAEPGGELHVLMQDILDMQAERGHGVLKGLDVQKPTESEADAIARSLQRIIDKNLFQVD